MGLKILSIHFYTESGDMDAGLLRQITDKALQILSYFCIVTKMIKQFLVATLLYSKKVFSGLWGPSISASIKSPAVSSRALALCYEKIGFEASACSQY